ncbi:MAG: hypothetical protein ACRDSH_13300 [Pseudonocardiaceae bacterium]
MSRARGGGPDALAPEFTVTPELLDALSPPVDRGGVVLGCGLYDELLSVSVLRPQPTRLVVIGGLALARLVTLRAMATGACVIIATDHPASWQPVVHAAGEGLDVPLVRPLEPCELPRAAQDAPLLVVQDGGAVPQELFPPDSPWQSTLYALPSLHPHAENIAVDADLVLLQRLPADQATLAARMWRLPAPMTHQLTTLDDDGVIALGQNLWLPLRLNTTPAEREIIGPVRPGT